ncbi:MAG TPA: phosphoribosyltransferase family protein [Chitinophagaceae bacterium]
MNAIQTITRSVTHLFFPQVCHGCGSDLVKKDQLLCFRCIHQLPYTRFQFHSGNPTEKIFWGRLPVRHAASIFYLTKDSILEKLLYQLKYKGRKEVGVYCGRLMAQAIGETEFAGIDSLIPLPLFPKKERKRGYNQAAILCNGIAEINGKPVLMNAVERTSTTETQTRKNRVERWKNMEGRFCISGAANLSGRHVLLVDDVITTGATLEACGSEIVKAGATLSLLTLGYAASRKV